MKKIISIVSTLILLLLGSYFLWSSLGRTAPPLNVQLHLDSSYVINTDSGKGNVIGINTYMTPEDYATADHFFQTIGTIKKSAGLGD